MLWAPGHDNILIQVMSQYRSIYWHAVSGIKHINYLKLLIGYNGN